MSQQANVATRYYPVGGAAGDSGEGEDLQQVLAGRGTVPAGEPVIGMVWHRP